MKVLTSITLALFVLVPGLWGQSFDSGSDGSFGPINITANTAMDLPEDGIIHATTVFIETNRELRFNPNGRNTPVHLLATGDIVIDGRIILDGESISNFTELKGIGGVGGAGGFPGGNAGNDDANIAPGDGHGPGAGKGGNNDVTVNGAGAAGYGVAGTPPTAGNQNAGGTYGNPLIFPLIGGSGGGGAIPAAGSNVNGAGAGGGGAILIASNTKIQLDGRVTANGGFTVNTAKNSGSGGAIRLVAPVIAGDGDLSATGGGFAGGGRIRQDSLDFSQSNITPSASASSTIGAVMFVDSTPPYRVDIIEAAGQAVPLDSEAPVLITLPLDADPNRTIKVRASGLTGGIPIEVVLTPDNGTASVFEAQIDMNGQASAEVTVNVTFPVNVRTRVNVWTK